MALQKALDTTGEAFRGAAGHELPCGEGWGTRPELLPFQLDLVIANRDYGSRTEGLGRQNGLELMLNPRLL
jgi:hypothetical protein